MDEISSYCDILLYKLMCIKMGLARKLWEVMGVKKPSRIFFQKIIVVLEIKTPCKLNSIYLSYIYIYIRNM